jgi:hypothetical protein
MNVVAAMRDLGPSGRLVSFDRFNVISEILVGTILYIAVAVAENSIYTFCSLSPTSSQLP